MVNRCRPGVVGFDGLDGADTGTAVVRPYNEVGGLCWDATILGL